MRAIWMSLFLPLAIGCNPFEEMEHFDIDGEEIVAIAGQSPTVGPLSVVPVDNLGDNLAQSMSKTFTNQGVDKNDVDSFLAKEILIEVTAPKDRDGQPLQDMRFFDKVSFHISAEGVGKEEITSSADDAFDIGVTKYVFPIDKKRNLKEYLVAESMTLSVEASANERPFLGCEIRFATVFAVDVNPGGIID